MGSLSGGQRQAVAVAKAVMWNSKLVIMDEPTAALGVAQTRMVLDLVRRLADRGLGVMVVSHNLNDVFEVADRIAVLQLGRMVAEGLASDLDRQIVVVVIVLICNADRGFLVPVMGMPWVVLIILGVLTAWTFLLGRTRFGRYVYAIGGNPEAARRAGVNLARIRTAAFVLSSLTAGVAGLIYASRLRSVSTNLDGGQLVLYAVAAAVIGGTSLFGGRGKALDAVLGGIVIAAIYNGMGLIGLSAALQYVVTVLVLVAAVTVDALARRGRATR